MRIGPKFFLYIAVLALVVSSSVAPAHADEAGRREIRCRYKIVRTVFGLAREQMRVRADCSERQAAGFINGEIDCLGDPQSGMGTGLPALDAKLLELRNRASTVGERIAYRCTGPFITPMSVGVADLCTPAITDRMGWTQAMECGYDLMSTSFDRLFELTYRRLTSGSQTIPETERYCRQVVGQAVRSIYRSRLRQRVDCFRKADKKGLDLDCLATAAWPGRVRETGLPDTDRVLASSFANLRSVIRTACGDGIDAMRFTENARIVDYTAGAPGGDAFTSEDLFHRLADAILQEETNAVARRIFPNGSYCGDGVVDLASGETCDDGNVDSCDGCDRDCTITACQNGAACGPTELCDDGNARLEDGCTDQCQFETCGDGVVQQGLGEACDDANTVDCDGCDSNCTASSVCHNGVACSAYGEECDDGLGLCASGVDARKTCVDDSDCRGTCSGGTSVGRPCTANADCGADVTAVCSPSKGCGGTCSGGAKNNALCAKDADCPGKCMPLLGQGQECSTNADCPFEMRCNGSLTCELTKQGYPCASNVECGVGAYCQASNGCMAGNSDTLGDRCRETCTLPTCGDGTVDAGTDTNGLGGELCDDGNVISGDGCDSNCSVTGCGNGVVTSGEQCDLGRGACVGGFDNLAACLFDTECRGSCANQPSQPCMPGTAVIDCGGGACVASSGCVGGNADGTLCRADCTLP